MPLEQAAFNFSQPEEEPVKEPESGAAPAVVGEENIAKVPAEVEEAVIMPAETTEVISDNKPADEKSDRGRKNLKDVFSGAELPQVPEDDVLFQKQYYSIGKVAEMFKVNISLIRFWENEFDILKPKKNAKGDRFFRPADVKTLQMIHHLLREKKYTIDGAREFLKRNSKAEAGYAAIESLKKLKLFLLELKNNL